MMTPTSIEAIATLTGEPVHPCNQDGTIYAVSRSWIVWYSKDDWHAVDRHSCLHTRHPSLRGALMVDIGDQWRDQDVSAGVDLVALRQHVKACGYTMADVAVRLGFVPTNKRVAKISG